jgi:hypothetical protein
MITLVQSLKRWCYQIVKGHYIQNAVADLEAWMKDKEYKLPKRAPTAMVASY